MGIADIGQGGQWVPATQAAQALGLSDRTLRRHIAAGRYQVRYRGRNTLVLLPHRTDVPDGTADASAARPAAKSAIADASGVTELGAVARDALALLEREREARSQAEQAAAMWQERARNLEAENGRLHELLALPAHEEEPEPPRRWWQWWRRG